MPSSIMFTDETSPLTATLLVLTFRPTDITIMYQLNDVWPIDFWPNDFWPNDIVSNE